MGNHKIVNGTTVQLTEEEEIQLASEWAAEEAKASEYAREERNNLLSSEVDPIVSNALRWNDMSEAKRTEWTNYRQALLDIEDLEGYPDNITWPTKP
tara:strand:+ start:671 stop:961 length:291 start_codon:yes stop_codon:yes gene_type:complete